MSKVDIYLIDRNTKAAANEAAALVVWFILSAAEVAVAAGYPQSEPHNFV